MSRSLAFAVALGAAAWGGPARAEPPYPTVDFQGEWVFSDGKGTEIRARMRYSAQARKMRLDMMEAGMTMASVRDMESGEMVMWSRNIPGMAMRLPTLKDDKLEATRTEAMRTIGEETCVVWTFKEAEACLTEENIPLETNVRGFTASLEGLARRRQDATLFEVPAGLSIMNLPSSLADGDVMKLGSGLPF